MVDKKEVAVREENKAAVPAFLRDQVAHDAGKGLSGSAEDNLVPLIYILQAQSPQCNKRSPDYVQGAEAGAIWLRNSGLPAVSGEEGLVFQPCFFQKDWVEWRPNREGYVGRHLERPVDAEEKRIDPQDPEKVAWVRPNGNIVVETRYHIGYALLGSTAMPFVIPMSGSGHTASRGWMARMNAKQMEGMRGAAPSWACLYRLKTKERSNKKGTWMTWEIEDEGWVQTLEDYERGAQLNAQFASGEKAVETPEEELAGTGQQDNKM